MGNDRRCGWIVPAVAGLLAGLALPPQGWPWLLWPALVPLWCQAGSPTRAGGLLWGLTAVLVSHRWLLWLHPLDWIGVPTPLSLPICLSLWLGIGLLGGLLVSGWLALMRRLDPTRISTAVFGASLWGLAEVVLAAGPLFWLGLGSSALPADPLLAGLARGGGAGTIAALQLLIGWCLWRWWTGPGPRRRWLVAGLGLVASAHLAGALLLRSPVPATAAQERLLALQPAIPTRRKFDPDQQDRLLGQLATAQRHTASAASISSLLLPEGSLSIGQPLPEAGPVEVLSGGFRREGSEQRSSVLRFAAGARTPSGWIDKHRVVPLGEWVPLAGLWRWSGLSAVGGIEPGDASRLLQRPGGAIGVAICYELSDGAALAAATRNGARWLLASANLDPYPPLLQEQFLALSRLRAIETGRWLVSVANTGPTVAIDPRGVVRQRLPAGRRTSGTMTVNQNTLLTPYDRWGDLPLLVVLLLSGMVRLRPLR